MRRYLERQLEVARESGGEGLIAELVRVEKNGGQISRNEMVSMVFLLLFAGHETTTHRISGSAHELLKNPGLRDWLEEDWRGTRQRCIGCVPDCSTVCALCTPGALERT
jgi:cytochrome P450